MAKAAEDAKKLRQEIGKIGDAGADAGADLTKTATALEKVEAAEQDVTAGSQQAANALEGVGTAALESSQAAVSGAQGAAQALEGVTAAAGEERGALLAAGDAAQQSGAETKAVLGHVTAAQELATAGARELGEATEQAAAEAQEFKAAIGLIEQMTDELRKSDLALELQKQGIAAVIDEVEKLVTAQAQLGASGKDNANLAAQSLTGLKAKLADVNEEIKRDVEAFRKFGGSGADALEAIGASAFTIDATTTAAAKHIESAWGQLNDNFAVTPKQLSLIAQAVAATEIAIVRAGERGQAVTIDQLALYEKQKSSLTELTAIANRLTNASRDNAVGLKQTGAQIAGVTNGVQQLTSMLGPNASKIGMVVGNVGQLGSVMEGLSASVKSMELNTLGTTASAGKLAVQYSAVTAVFLAAAAAGVKVAETNDQNAESINRLWKETKNLGAGTWDAIKDGLSGVQAGLRETKLAWNDYIDTVKDGTDDSEIGVRAARDLDIAQQGLAAALRSGESARLLYNIALRDGLPSEQAARLAIYDNGKAMQFYEDSTRGGAEGHQLWTQALRESFGSTATMTAFIKANTAEMQNAIKSNERMTAARREDTVAALALRQVLDQLDTAGLNNVVGMIAFADAIDDAAGKVKTLTDDERERLKLISDLLRRGEDLTDAQKQQIATLLSMARAGKDASGALNTLLRLQLSFEQATNGSTESLRDSFTVLRTLAGAWDLNSQSIRTSISDAQAALDKTDNLTAAQRRQHQTVIDGLRAMDAARAQSAALESARVATMVTAEDELTRRGAEATRAIQQRLTDLAQLIPMSATYGGVLRDLGGQLQSVVDGTITLSAEDRGRLEVIIELVAKGGELTASQQAFAVSLVNAALAADKATTSGNALAKVQADIDRATSGTTTTLQTNLGVLATLATSWDTNSVALKKAVAELENTLGATDGLTEAQRKLYEQVIEGIKNIDTLTKSKKDLEEEQKKLLDIGMQMTQEQFKQYESNRLQIYSIQGQIEATKEHSKAQVANLETTKQVITSTSELVKTGAHEWTNIGTAQQGAAAGAAAAGEAATKAAGEVGTAGQQIGDASGNVGKLGDAASETTTHLGGVGRAASDAASELSESSQKWLDSTQSLESVAAKIERLERLFRATADQMERVTTNAGPMAAAIEAAGNSATKASGYATGKVQETG